MNYVVDILVAILLMFIILYALKQRTSKYVLVFLTFFLPLVIIFFTGDFVYINLLKIDGFVNGMKDVFAGKYFLSGYLLTEIILYFILVILLKIIFSFFKKTSLIADEKKAEKKRLYVNLVLALVLGYFSSCVFVACLYPIGLTNDNTVLEVVYQNSVLVDLNETNQLNENLQIYESVVEVMDRLGIEEDDPNLLTQIEAYASSQGPHLRGRVQLFLQAVDPTDPSPLHTFVDQRIIKPYQKILIKKQVVREALSKKILEDDKLVTIVVDNWTTQLQLDINNLSVIDTSKLEQALEKLALTKNATEKIKSSWQ